jgi:sulfofructose kinase
VTPPIDILGLGAVAVDDVLFVDRFPPPDAKTPVLRRERHCGGLTATALVAAQRLGARCAYAGVLGRDDLSAFAIQAMAAETIDLSHLRQTEAARPLNSIIVVDQARQTRNIFVDFNGVVGAAPDWPPDEIVQTCRVLFLDYIGVPGMLRAAGLARAAGIPVVADIEATDPQVARLMDTVDHLILSWEFAGGLTYAATPDKAALALWQAGRQAVVITCGDQGAWYVAAEAPGRAVHQPAFPVAVVDTNGCGDVFHGAYAAALGRGQGMAERVRFASAAAALKATRAGGQAGAPRLAEVEQFLKERDT